MKQTYARGEHPNSKQNLANARRKHSINGSFFSRSGFEQGYYAGFLAADGCIRTPREGGEPNSFSWACSRKDRKVLEDFLEITDATYTIHDYESHGFPQSRIQVTNPEMVRDLGDKYNITPRKSLTLQPPEGLDRFTADGFVKGYIDGDGCVRANNRNRVSIQVCGTEGVLSFLADQWSNAIGVPVPGPRKITGKNLHSLDISKAKARKVFEYYYALPLGLPRKWDSRIHTICANYRWYSQKYLKNAPRYEYLRANSGRLTVKKMADELSCTPENIYMILNHSEGYAHYCSEHETKVLDEANKVSD